LCVIGFNYLRKRKHKKKDYAKIIIMLIII
jgi:hypothetical protein